MNQVNSEEKYKQFVSSMHLTFFKGQKVTGQINNH